MATNTRSPGQVVLSRAREIATEEHIVLLSLFSLLPFDSALCSTKQHLANCLTPHIFSAFQPQSHFYRAFSRSVPLHVHGTSTELSQWRCGSHPFRFSDVNGTDAPALPSVLSGIQPSAHSTCCNWILYCKFSSTARSCFTSKRHIFASWPDAKTVRSLPSTRGRVFVQLCAELVVFLGPNFLPRTPYCIDFSVLTFK